MFKGAAKVVETTMADTVQFLRRGVPYLETKARVQPRRNVGQRNLQGHDVVQEQFVQIQMPTSVADKDIRVDDEVVITSSQYNPDLVGRVGYVVDVLNASHIIEFTVGAWFDLQKARRVDV